MGSWDLGRMGWGFRGRTGTVRAGGALGALMKSNILLIFVTEYLKQF